MVETSGFITVSTKLERIAKLAREMPQAALTTLAHHIDIDWLREAYRRTRKDGATGVDRQTANEYAKNLEENLRSLLERAKAATWRHRSGGYIFRRREMARRRGPSAYQPSRTRCCNGR
jgi:RNA-directed DNA polymerase